MKGKNIIILGEPRCGKTTLTNCIVSKYGYEVIRGDVIRDSLYRLEKSTDLIQRYKNTSKKGKDFLYTYYDTLNIDLKFVDRGIVVDDTEITLQDCVEHFDINDNLIYCLGITTLSTEELFNNVITYSKDNEWSSHISPFSLHQICNTIIRKSKELEEECKKYSYIKFYNTGKDRQSVLEDIMYDIGANIQINNA